MKIPRELEKFMVYGVLQCTDSFLYIHTFLPIRYILGVWAIIWRPIATVFGLRRRGQRLLAPAEICDLLKGTIWIFCTLLMISIDTNRIYHIIKSQSVIKLYIFYNMLEVGDRLLSAFGQDIIDALFWTATEPKERSDGSGGSGGGGGRAHLGVLAHICFAIVYVVLHSVLIMFQATSLNVAINSNNKGLLGIMMSNNFVELKGSVFKKFDKNNLFQLTCSDVRERVHLTVLLFVVVIQTMKEFNWRAEHFFILLPDCAIVLIVEVFIDWIKHAFITRFNELPADVYKEYTISLAYDMTQTRQKHAFSDHSDLVARRMGFIPFPLGVVLIKAIYTAVPFDNFASIILFALGFFTLITCRTLNTICTLGKACDLMQKHQDDKNNAMGITPMMSTTSTGIFHGGGGGGINVSSQQQQQQHHHQTASIFTSMNLNLQSKLPIGIGLLPLSPVSGAGSGFSSAPIIGTTTSAAATTTCDHATSPIHFTFLPLQKSQTIDCAEMNIKTGASSSSSSSSPSSPQAAMNSDDCEISLNLGATALFSNSDVDLDYVCLNEQLSKPVQKNDGDDDYYEDHQPHTRSVPDLQQSQNNEDDDFGNIAIGGSGGILLKRITGMVDGGGGDGSYYPVIRRTHKRSESEPSIQSPLLETTSMANTIANNSERF